MSLLVVGSIALDTLRMPDGKVHKDVIGGSCTFFSHAASFFSRKPIRLVSVVGGDFNKKYLNALKKRPIDLAGLEVDPQGKTFRWAGTYAKTMNDRTTDDTQLNVLGSFDPKLPEAFRDSQFVFLACAVPEVQLRVLDQMRRKPVAVCDTIEFYIHNSREALMKVFKRCDGVVVNDYEASLLFEDVSAVRCAQRFLKLGMRFALVKKGEHGVILATKDGTFAFPAFPLAKVADPTGAGDAFAGGFMGWLDRAGNDKVDTLRQGVVAGTATASLVCEGVSITRLARATDKEVNARAAAYADMLRIPGKAF